MSELTANVTARARIAGAYLAMGAIAIWVSWALMPDAATNDAEHILRAVGATREQVAWSARVQIVGAVLVVPGVTFAIARRSSRAFWGGVLLVVGAAGQAADAVYHQLAVEMTAPGVDRGAVLPVMVAMQTRDIRTLAPMLLAFLAGAPWFVWGLHRDGRIARWIVGLALASLAVMAVGVPGVVLFGLARRWVVLGVLGAMCASVALSGLAIGRETAD